MQDSEELLMTGKKTGKKSSPKLLKEKYSNQLKKSRTISSTTKNTKTKTQKTVRNQKSKSKKKNKNKVKMKILLAIIVITLIAFVYSFVNY